MFRQAYECPAIVELGTLHDRTLSWMAGADGGGFGGYLSKHNASVRKFGSFTIMGDDDSGSGSDDSFGQVKSSGSKSKHGGDSAGGDRGGSHGGGKHGSSGHGGFNVSDVFKGFGGSH